MTEQNAEPMASFFSMDELTCLENRARLAIKTMPEDSKYRIPYINLAQNCNYLLELKAAERTK